jgi:beta-phosphoglucomutase-like phosphatase (HAD superfamily)
VHPDALIFDLDGNLWDTCETCAVAWNDVLVRLGIDPHHDRSGRPRLKLRLPNALSPLSPEGNVSKLW